MLVWSSALVRRWQFGDVRILGLTSAIKGQHGLWPDARKRLFELLSRLATAAESATPVGSATAVAIAAAALAAHL